MKAAGLILLACIALAGPVRAICTGEIDCKVCTDCTRCLHCSGETPCGRWIEQRLLRKAAEAKAVKFRWVSDEGIKSFAGFKGSALRIDPVVRETDWNLGEIISRRYILEAEEINIRIRVLDRKEAEMWSRAKAPREIVLAAELLAKAEAREIVTNWADVQQLAASLEKFLEWDKVARAAKAERFEKPLATGLHGGTVEFEWIGEEEEYRTGWLGPIGLGKGDVEHILAFLRAELPGAQKELRERKAKREKEAALFK